MRLDIERQKRLEPTRKQKAIDSIIALGYEIEWSDEHMLVFRFEGEKVQYYPYSGWATGKTIKDGRGLNKLLKQIQK